MASTPLFLLSLLSSILHLSLASRQLTDSLLHYHNGLLLTGNISVNLIWYGPFKSHQKSIVSDFISSVASGDPSSSVATWWKTTHKYYTASKTTTPNLRLGKQVSDTNHSLGKTLTNKQLVYIASKGEPSNAVNVVLTSNDVVVEGFCSSRCGTHGSSISRSRSSSAIVEGKSSSRSRSVYIWVGDSVSQCPGQCAWPFHEPVYGPQGAALVAPNDDVGLDGMVINVASLLAGAVTNPFGDGYYQGDAGAPLEAASACVGVYGKGAYPGYAGEVLVDASTGASYNAEGTSGRKFLLPALFDPSTATCSTLV